MRRFNEVPRLFKSLPLNSAILVLLVVLFGAFLAPTDSDAQAVPPRVQTDMINKPVVLPPEPPLQKEIREIKQYVRDRPPKIINNYYPVPPDNIHFLENQIKKMEYQIAVLEAELSRLRQELRRRQR